MPLEEGHPEDEEMPSEEGHPEEAGESQQIVVKRTPAEPTAKERREHEDEGCELQVAV